MTQPSQIIEELVDFLTSITFDSIFRDGILQYGFSNLKDSNTVNRAHAFLKLFLLAPRLILSSSQGVAMRSRLLLTGTQTAFESLFEQSCPKDKTPTAIEPLTEKQRQTKIQDRVSVLIKSCDLSRAMNALMGIRPQPVTEALVQKIHDLHPEAAPEHRIPASAPTRIRIAASERLFKDNDLERVIKDLRVHAAPDMTGLRPSHIKCIFRGRRENDSPEARCRVSLSRLIHLTFEDPAL
jgi:hypothetical protein